jgi:hypothetical protein
MAEDGPFVVLIETAAISDLEDLRDAAFACAHQRGRVTRTIHWDEARGANTAFCFELWEAAFLFICHCAREGIRYRAE